MKSIPTSLLNQLDSLLTGFWLTDLANFSAFFFYELPNINWIGFYLTDGKQLRLGPFSGKPACVEIAFSRGVCGTAFSGDKTLIVPDVHAFPGHITCDPASRSELVIPFRVGGRPVGVLDVDSPILNRFTEEEARLLSDALAILAKRCPDLRGFAR
jgi:GAF domain-containing protein